MVLDPVLVSLFSTLGKAAYDGIQQLIDSKIIMHKGLTFYHQSKEFEFAFVISLGEERSDLDRILQKIKGVVKKPVTFENVVGISGYGLTNNEDLVKLGIISLSKNTANIDFAKLRRDVKSSVVFIKIRVRIREELKKLLVLPRIEKTSQNIDHKQIETRIEVVLDYANLWNKVFDQYTVRDIDFTFTLIINLKTIMDQIPQRQAKRIIQAARLASGGNADAIRFLRVIRYCFLSFENDSMMALLRDSVSIEPAENFFVKEISPAMQLMEISDSGYPVVLPGKMRIKLGCMIEGNKVAVMGKLIIDVEKFSKVLDAISQDMQKKTLKLKF